jgi:hypothetical protein
VEDHNLVEWLIPWRGRGDTGSEGVNFLARLGRVYVMDNHRFAPWCFWQHRESAATWRLFHIDRHPDSADDRVDWPRAYEALRQDLTKFEEVDCIRWDNIIRAVHGADTAVFSDIYMSVSEADEPIPDFVTGRYDVWHLEGKLRHIVVRNEEGDDESPWWIDLDLDYFTTHWDHRPLFREDWIKSIGSLLWSGLYSSRIGLVTIALSPSTTGSWIVAEELLEVLSASWPDEMRLRLPLRNGGEAAP